MLSKFFRFIKKEAVLSTAGILAVISSFIVRPSREYISYIDFRVLSLLFCLMLVVAGLQSIGLFHNLAAVLLRGVTSSRRLILLLVSLCFFSSMLITNDVALITFVPFTVMILSMANKKELLIPVISLQTIAANLGSMLTPIGNPQNLYLSSTYNISIGDFLLTMLPLTMASFVLLVAAVFLIKETAITIPDAPQVKTMPKFRLVSFGILFIVCLLCVIRILDYRIMFLILVLGIALTDKSLFKKADYFLLLTFVFFFIFIGNMERIPSVANILNTLVRGREFYLGVLLSQFISNVPAAFLLSGFSGQWKPLLYGVNIGGLGTLIASLASVISYRAYAGTKDSKNGSYMLTFTVYNIVFLAILSFMAVLLL